MAIALPEPVRGILRDKSYGHVVTFNPSGSPQVTLVWMDVEGDDVLFNTAEGRIKPRNLRRDPRVIVSVQDPSNPRAYAVFRGQATLVEAGADAHIDRLAKKFLDVETYPFRRPGEKRLTVRVKVDQIGGNDANLRRWTST
jgi:PPOX class probable F420-dependent enzyme